LASAAYDGIIVKHEGWIPTEAFPTENVNKYHKEEVNKTILSFMSKATKKE
jgi:hypothetical protein